MPTNINIDQFLGATRAAAIAAWRWRGKGDAKRADKAAVDAFRTAFATVDCRGEIVIGEGRKDDSYEIPAGERLGSGKGPALDIAVDPLECTTNTAFNKPNAIVVIAIGPRGALYHGPDGYMEKLVVGREARNVVDLSASPAINIKKIAKACGKKISDVTVAVLERPRHEKLIKEILATGARVELSTDGDVSMAIRTCIPGSSIDALMGVGGSTEAVLAATAVGHMGGAMLCRWKPKDEAHIRWLHEAGIKKFDTILRVDDLARGPDTQFIATGVIGGSLLRGVEARGRWLATHSMVVSKDGVRYIEQIS